MKRAQGPRRSLSGSTEDEDQEEESELVYPSGQQQRVLNLQHYVGHSLVKQQPQTTSPPPNFRPLSRTQQQPAAFQPKKPGLKLAHSNGSVAKPSELTCLQRRAAELTGVPLINFNIKRSASVRGDIPMDNDSSVKPETQVKLDDFNPHQHPPLYQPHQIHNLVVQQHLRFLSAYQHSGLLAMKKDLPPPPSSPTLIGLHQDPGSPQDRILKKNYSMCEDLLNEHDTNMKNLWDKDSGNEFNYSIEDHLNNNRVNFKLGATLSLPPQMIMVAGQKESDGFSIRNNNEFQMGKEDEARFLPTDLLSDETTTSEQLSLPTTAGELPAAELENDYGYTDVKSLPTFIGDSASPSPMKKQSLRKTLSLQGDPTNLLFPTVGSSDFSLFPQTSQSDLLCSLRSSLVKNSAENSEVNKARIEVEELTDLDDQQQQQQQQLPARKITTSRHLERAIKSLSINTDISRKF